MTRIEVLELIMWVIELPVLPKFFSGQIGKSQIKIKFHIFGTTQDLS